MGPLALAGIGAGLGALGGLFGRDNNQSTVGYTGGTDRSSSSFTPAPMAENLYGYVGGIGNQMGNTPTPYFPGVGYVGPSGPTQAGVNSLMSTGQNIYDYTNKINSGSYLRPAANRSSGGGGVSVRAPSGGRGGGGVSGFVPSGGKGFQSEWDQVVGMGEAGQYLQGANPYYTAAGQYGMDAIPGMQGLLGQAGTNYGFLSNAADIANNPYVQQMLGANASAIQEMLDSNMATTAGGAAAGGMLGSSADALMRGQAMGDAAGELARTNASTMLSAYDQGLAAQQMALGFTPELMQAQMMPAQAAAYGGDLQRQLAELQNQIFGTENQILNQRYGTDADYAASTYGTDAGYAASIYGADKNYDASIYSSDASLEAARIRTDADLKIAAEDARLKGISLAQEIENRATMNQLMAGNIVEGYQERALQDAMARFGYQYEEPWMRMNNIGGAMGLLAPLGTNNSSGATTGAQSGTNPNYQSPLGAILQGVIGGGFTGYGLGT
jgi:hypothetical protein